jgi:hypothetical protein
MSLSPALTASEEAQPARGPAERLREDLTYVELVHRPGQVERWIRFGEVQDELIVSRSVRFQGFAPGSLFAFVRWSAGDFGTVSSRIDILRVVARGEALTTVPGVIPGGESLLRLSSWPQVERVLNAIDAVEALGIAPCDTAPDYWRHLHHRLVAGEPTRAYSWERHLAWLARRSLLS